MRDPHLVIVRPHITEKSVALSYGPEDADDRAVQRQYTFVVAPDANKIEIKHALEAIYNAGKRDRDEKISVTKVRTITVRGKMRRVGAKRGKKPDFKKAVVTLGKGQLLEDYGV